MSFVDDPARPSVAPPGWTPSPAFAPPPAAPAESVTPVEGADAAVRWRLRAARVDNIIVSFAYGAICLLMHRSVTSLGSLWLFAVLSVGYHFGFESRGGQTPGKRRYGIQVLGVDGRRASTRAVAIRSVLRVIDQLPVSYVSGLISMVRTGPNRRQRIGDIAAGTVVVAVDGRAVERGTPSWFLPAATVFAVVLSAMFAVAVFHHPKPPAGASPAATTSFPTP